MGDAAARSILDHRGRVDLEKILVRFGAPVSEERAWALCYSSVQCYFGLDSHDKANSALVTSLQHIVLHKDGYVHPDTFLAPCGSITSEGATAGPRRELGAPESKMVSELGWVLYSALDYGLGNAEERELAPALHNLIEQMTSADSERCEPDDEGIERDLGRTFSLKDALQECEKRLTANSSITAGASAKKFSSSGKSSAKTSPVRTPITSPSSFERTVSTPAEHYRAVIRVFVTEAQDLQQFLATVAEGSKFLKTSRDLLSSQYDIDQLQCTDWAVLWKQVMLQLREGVKLKKVDYSKTPLEYTLTPYEMLMEDIRSRRYTLNKVMVNGDIPQKVKKDAHSIILDFIRSRPPLRKASERRLAPIHRVSSPMELLLESIKKDHNLRHVQTPLRPRSAVLGRVTSEGALSQPKRKLIAAPRITLDIEDDDDDDLSDIPPSSPPLGSHYLSGGSAPPTMRRSTHRPDTATDRGGSQSQWSRLAYDLATYVSPNGTNSDNRRHSICVCETPGSSTPPTPSPPPGPAPRLMGPIPSPAGGSNLYTPPKGSPPSLPVRRTFSATTSMGSSPANALTSHSQNQRDFLSSAHFAAHLDCLSLTLEEVVHIRNVLTKADLEALPLDLTIKEDVARGKICFLCMKVRFSFFGQWSVECRLCKRNVCKKCVSKMRIPTEHFGNIPVLMLTPQALSPREDEEESPAASLSRQFFSRLQEFPRGTVERRVSMSTSVGSAPSSPSSTHRGGPPYSLPGPSPNSPPFVHDDIKSLKRSRSANDNHTHDGCVSWVENNLIPDSFFPSLLLAPSGSCNSGFKKSLKRLFRSRRKSSVASSCGACNVTPEILKQEQRQQIRSGTSPGGRDGGECTKEQLRGQLMSVCGDCKAMVLHVLLSIRLGRDQHQHRAKTPSPPPPPPKHIPQRHHLHLNLTPVYN